MPLLPSTISGAVAENQVAVNDRRAHPAIDPARRQRHVARHAGVARNRHVGWPPSPRRPGAGEDV